MESVVAKVTPPPAQMLYFQAQIAGKLSRRCLCCADSCSPSVKIMKFSAQTFMAWEALTTLTTAEIQAFFSVSFHDLLQFRTPDIGVLCRWHLKQ